MTRQSLALQEFAWNTVLPTVAANDNGNIYPAQSGWINVVFVVVVVVSVLSSSTQIPEEPNLFDGNY